MYVSGKKNSEPYSSARLLLFQILNSLKYGFVRHIAYLLKKKVEENTDQLICTSLKPVQCTGIINLSFNKA